MFIKVFVVTQRYCTAKGKVSQTKIMVGQDIRCYILQTRDKCSNGWWWLKFGPITLFIQILICLLVNTTFKKYIACRNVIKIQS